MAALGGTLEDVGPSQKTTAEGGIEDDEEEEAGLLAAVERARPLVGPKLTAQLCVALGQLHAHTASTSTTTDIIAAAEGSGAAGEDFLPVLTGLVGKWAPRMRAAELIETATGLVALSAAPAARRALLSPRGGHHTHNTTRTYGPLGALTSPGSGGGTGAGAVGGLAAWEAVWADVTRSRPPASSDCSLSLAAPTATGVDDTAPALALLATALNSGGGGGPRTLDDLSAALETLQLHGIAAGRGDDDSAVGVLSHPRHRALATAVQTAVIDAWMHSLTALTTAPALGSLTTTTTTTSSSSSSSSTTGAVAARREGWLRRSTRLLVALGAVCGPWGGWDERTQRGVAEVLQRNTTLQALYGGLLTPPAAASTSLSNTTTSQSSRSSRSGDAAGAGAGAGRALAVRVDFLLALGRLHVPLFVPSATTAVGHVAAAELPAGHFAPRPRAVYRHLAVTLLAKLPQRSTTSTTTSTSTSTSTTSGAATVPTTTSPLSASAGGALYAALLLALRGCGYRPTGPADGLFRALLWHNGAVPVPRRSITTTIAKDIHGPGDRTDDTATAQQQQQLQLRRRLQRDLALCAGRDRGAVCCSVATAFAALLVPSDHPPQPPPQRQELSLPTYLARQLLLAAHRYVAQEWGHPRTLASTIAALAAMGLWAPGRVARRQVEDTIAFFHTHRALLLDTDHGGDDDLNSEHKDGGAAVAEAAVVFISLAPALRATLTLTPTRPDGHDERTGLREEDSDALATLRETVAEVAAEVLTAPAAAAAGAAGAGVTVRQYLSVLRGVAGTFADACTASEAHEEEADEEEEEGGDGDVLAWGQQRHVTVGRFDHGPTAAQSPSNTPPAPPLDPALPSSLRTALLRPLTTAGLAAAMTASELLATVRCLGAVAVQWKDLDSVTTKAVVTAVSDRHNGGSDDPPPDSVATMTVAAARLRRAAGILGAPDDTWTLDPTPSHPTPAATDPPSNPAGTTSVDGSSVSISTSSPRSGPRSHAPAPLVPTFTSLPQLRDQFPRLPLAALPAVLWTCHRQGHSARYATRSLGRCFLAFVMSVHPHAMV